RHVVRRGQLAHRCRAPAQSRHDLDAGGVGERCERLVDRCRHSELVGSVLPKHEPTSSGPKYQRGKKSSSSAFTASGASHCIQWSGPSMRSYRNVLATYFAESVICGSSSAKSLELHTPIVGACTGGNSMGEPVSASGVIVAR